MKFILLYLLSIKIIPTAQNYHNHQNNFSMKYKTSEEIDIENQIKNIQHQMKRNTKQIRKFLNQAQKDKNQTKKARKLLKDNIYLTEEEKNNTIMNVDTN